MQGYLWDRFVLRIPVNASVRQVYHAWTSRQGIESWFLREAIFSRKGKPLNPTENIKAGDNYTWRWHGWPDDVVETDDITEANCHNVISFGFGKAGNVKVSIDTENGTTVLVLEQTEIPVDDNSKLLYHFGCMKGWLFYITNLKSVLEGGKDLRNRDVGLKDVVNS